MEASEGSMRISREMMLMEWAYTASKRGTCGRLAVGAVIALESRPISAGYVGAGPGELHCEEAGCDLTQPCRRTTHAEINAIKFAQARMIDIRGADMYVTDSPCLACADEIIFAKLRRVFFDREYRQADGIQRLLEYGVEVHRILANGIARRY
jgi:dCMP deaminase